MNTEASHPPPLPTAPDHRRRSVIEALLKSPAQIAAELCQPGLSRLILSLCAIGLIGFALYGVVVGSLSGGQQFWIAPVKILLGLGLSVGICFPSLYIFTALAGADLRPIAVAGSLFATVAMAAMLLVGFAPVAWIFSQSTGSIGVVAFLHFAFWVVALGFGIRIVRDLIRLAGGRDSTHLRVWCGIFLLVSLQMTTTLRPIMAPSDHFFPTGKKFFLAQWMETIASEPAGRDD